MTASFESVYAETPPPPTLAHVVECAWEASGASAGSRVLPDGCVDVMIDMITGRGRVIGTMTRALVVPPGPCDLVALRLRPGAARAALSDRSSRKEAVHEWTDGDLDLRDVWPDTDGVIERLAAMPREARAEGLLAELEKRRPAAVDSRIEAAIARLRQPGGSVADLSEQLGISRQFLTRQFRLNVGVGPKTLARVFRLRRLLDVVSRQPGLPWSLAALDAGYYDQSHMIGEFRELTGATPTGFHSSNLAADDGSTMSS